MDFDISDQELLQLMDDLESVRSERKESFGRDVADKVRQAICAFANDLAGAGRPGVLFVGVNDDGRPSHLPITDDLILKLAAMRTDGRIMPMPAMVVEKKVLKGVEVAVVKVLPSDIPPVKYDGRVWVRTGANRALASVQEERVLAERRRYKNLPYDLYPVTSTSLKDLSKSIFENDYLPQAFAPDVLERNGRTYEEKLASCRMIVSPDEPVPTIVGLLAIGKCPQDFLPGSSIQFLRIAGTELTDPVVDAELITGNVAEMLRRANDKFRAYNRSAVDVVSAETHSVAVDYPAVAVQQILYNAVLHRTYEGTNAPVRFYWFDDRIEISSPGGVYGSVTKENFGKPGYTDYRNPNLAEVLRVYGFVQAFGRGIALANDAMTKAGLSSVEFEVSASWVIATLWSSRHG